MDKTTKVLAFVLVAVVALLVGGIFTYWLFPQTITKEVTKEVQVPVDRIVYVNQTVKVPVEVIKEVPVVTTVTKNVPMDFNATYLQPAEKDFMDKLVDDDSTMTCAGQVYDDSQIVISKVYDDYSMKVTDAKLNEYEVAFRARVKYLDSDVQEKCTRTFNAVIDYHPESSDTTPDVLIS